MNSRQLSAAAVMVGEEAATEKNEATIIKFDHYYVMNSTIN